MTQTAGEAPLHFRSPRPRLTNNKQQASQRLASVCPTLKKRPEMRKHFADFMQNLFDNRHAEPAPPPKEQEECWPQSQQQPAGRFCEERVAVTADIRQMFHCFLVREDHRNFLRFLWHQNNDMEEPIVEYRMRVHVFGNSPSPAVVIYGLRRASQDQEDDDCRTRRFVEQHFYVHDGLISFPTSRALLRELTIEACEWDDPLPERKLKEWREWKDSLKDLEHVRIPRTYTSISLSSSTNREPCIFCNASTQAIAAVAYIKVTNAEGKSELGFVFGKAKLAPQPEGTIPRLELCAAILAVEIADMLTKEMGVQFYSVRFFTDSKVVLGYIHNESRRFYVYVSNRVQRIRKSSLPEQWNYVPTDANPADHASRSIPSNTLMSSMWLKGADFPLKPAKNEADSQASFDLVDPKSDPEICPSVTSCVTQVAESPLDPRRFESFSSWRSLVRTVSRLIHIASSFKQENSKSNCQGWHICRIPCPEDLVRAKGVILRSLQYKALPEVFACIQVGKEIPEQSQLRRLSPYLDDAGCLRVGGRLSQADLQSDERNPLTPTCDLSSWYPPTRAFLSS
ncbi:hypothetical protein SKAU_G00246940 [Synaphobranchus kaupii]|uniref:Uncharacterized protein n=1 Tax=Synaphobranchus kaupii TaxID=118154 RepID=A0A9Q1IPF1_SYNKA|nr:hypothetical protein SKAU_G00246940 [Synaphobranchus kaupii]